MDDFSWWVYGELKKLHLTLVLYLFKPKFENYQGIVTGIELFDNPQSTQGYLEKNVLIELFRPKSKTAASIILRGANDFMVEEMDRSIHDALCVVKRVIESKSIVPGGGCVEAALSIYLENFATSLVSYV